MMNTASRRSLRLSMSPPLKKHMKRTPTMTNDILSQYGPGTSQPQRGVISKGGVMPGDTKDVRNYAYPCGPKNIMDPKSPGLHGTNQGITNGQDNGGSHSGSPGLGGTNYGCCGSQGKY